MYRIWCTAIPVVLLSLTFSGCGGNSTSLASDPALNQDTPAESLLTVWPTQLPAGGVQPWEQVDENGMVVPPGNSRADSAFDLNSETELTSERSSALDGSIDSDWTPNVITAWDSVSGYLHYSSLTVIAGVPAIAVCWDDNIGNLSLHYVESQTASGSDASDWDVEQVAGFINDAGEYCSLAEVDGRAAICFYNATLGDLRYAIRY